MSVSRRPPSRSATAAVTPKVASASASSAGDRVAVTKRLRTELMTLMSSNTVGISAFPEGDDLFQWGAIINGVEGTPYAGMEFNINMKFSANYPYEAPTVTFVTPIFHPNIDTSGNICLDILKDKWSALLDVRSILLSIQSLLGEPNNESPLNGQAAALWVHAEEFRRVALKKYQDALAAASK